MVTLYLGYTQPIDNAFVFFFLLLLFLPPTLVFLFDNVAYTTGKRKKIKRNTLHGKGSKKSLGSFRTGNRIKANETTSEQLDSIWNMKKKGDENWKVGGHHTTQCKGKKTKQIWNSPHSACSICGPAFRKLQSFCYLCLLHFEICVIHNLENSITSITRFHSFFVCALLHVTVYVFYVLCLISAKVIQYNTVAILSLRASHISIHLKISLKNFGFFLKAANIIERVKL